MAQERDFDDSPSGDMRALESGAALGLALAVASRDKADAFLDAQTEIARLQKEHLHEQRGLLFSHLEWQGFSDFMRAGWQVVLAVLGLIAFIAILTALWNASRADGLVVDAFSVPPSFEQKGVGGDVVASDITGKLTGIRELAMAHSYSVSRDVTSDRSKDIKVEIPETGVSVSEAWRLLKGWLGRERHLTGNLREDGDGEVVLTASLDGGGAISERGAATDLPALEDKVAEQVFAIFDRVNDVNYLTSMGRHRDAYAAAQRYAPLASTTLERADSYALLSYTSADATGNLEQAETRARIGIAIDPSLAVAHVMAGRFDLYLGRDEDVLREEKTILGLHNEDQPEVHQTGGFAGMQDQARAKIARLQGDFADGVNWDCAHTCTLSGTLLAKSAAAASVHDVPSAMSLLRQGLATGNPDSGGANEARYAIDSERGDWKAALDDEQAVWNDAVAPDGDASRLFLTEIAAALDGPSLATAQAHAGRFAQAHATIDRTPRDCALCDTARGDVDALEGNTTGAAFWYARASVEGPSIPFADTDWGRMLLAKGDIDGAMARFAAANQKGPRYADPLELWGEALMRKDRADLALAKFEQTDRYAPNWGRLHLKWGEALLWSGDKEGAQKQFALASTLYLTAFEQAELARVRIVHG